MSTRIQRLLLRNSCEAVAYAALLQIKSSVAIHDRYFTNILGAAVLYTAKEAVVSHSIC